MVEGLTNGNAFTVCKVHSVSPSPPPSKPNVLLTNACLGESVGPGVVDVAGATCCGSGVLGGVLSAARSFEMPEVGLVAAAGSDRGECVGSVGTAVAGETVDAEEAMPAEGES